MPSLKTLIPLVLLAAAVVASPQVPVDLAGTAGSAISKTLQGREEGRELIQVYSRQILNEKGAGGNAGNGGSAGAGGEGVDHGKGGNGARGGAAGDGGEGNYFSGKFSNGEGRRERDGEEYGNRFKRVYRRQETDRNGGGGTGGFGGSGSTGGNGKEYGRGGMGAKGGRGGKGGHGHFFSGVAEVEEKKDEFY